MNAPHRGALLRPSLAELAFAELAPAGSEASAEGAWLGGHAAAIALLGEPIALWVGRWNDAPPERDRSLAVLAATLQLAPVEVLAVALACAVETDAMAARALAWLQAPVGGARPTAGLLADLAARWDGGAEAGPQALAQLAAGAARESGLIRIDDAQRPLPEAAVSVPQPIVLALGSAPRRHWPGLRLALHQPPPLPPSIRAAAAAHARALTEGSARALAVRSGHPREAQAAAAEVAAQLHAQAVFVDGEPPSGLGPWLWLVAGVPVVCAEPGPGERRRITPIAGWSGPILVAAGPDGSFEYDGAGLPDWRVAVPGADERDALWQLATGDAALAARLGRAAPPCGGAHRRTRPRGALRRGAGRARCARRRRRRPRRAQAAATATSARWPSR